MATLGGSLLWELNGSKAPYFFMDVPDKRVICLSQLP